MANCSKLHSQAVLGGQSPELRMICGSPCRSLVAEGFEKSFVYQAKSVLALDIGIVVLGSAVARIHKDG